MQEILDWKIREWLEYHQKRVHQGSVNGSPELQQTWMGRVMWKNPLDCWIYQEILHETRPEVIVELGVAHGGTLLYLSNLLDIMGLARSQVVGVDIDLSRVQDLKIPRMHLIGGNCLDPSNFQQVASLCNGRRTMVIADCDHSRDHVYEELRHYSQLVSIGDYYIVEDGICDVMNWKPVPGPRSAVDQFLKSHDQFIDDAGLREKYLITYNPSGYLKRVR